MPLDKLPGIAKGVRRKLEAAGVRTIPELHRLDPRHARLIWRSVEGERFVRALRGEDIPIVATRRHGYGNSKVLAPKNRNLENAYAVSRWLVEGRSPPAPRRPHRERVLHPAVLYAAGWWADRMTSFPSQDTMHFQELNRILRRRFYLRTRFRCYMTVSVRLGRVAGPPAARFKFHHASGHYSATLEGVEVWEGRNPKRRQH